MPATPGGVGVPDIGRVLIDDILYSVKSARTTATTSGLTQIVAAVVGKRIKPLAWTIGPVSAAVTVQLEDTAGTPVVVVGPAYCAANGGIANGTYKETDQIGTSGLAININISGNVNSPVHLWYVEV